MALESVGGVGAQHDVRGRVVGTRVHRIRAVQLIDVGKRTSYVTARVIFADKTRGVSKLEVLCLSTAVLAFRPLVAVKWALQPELSQ